MQIYDNENKYEYNRCNNQQELANSHNLRQLDNVGDNSTHSNAYFIEDLRSFTDRHKILPTENMFRQ